MLFRSDRSEARYVADWDILENEALRQAHALVEEKGNAIFGKRTGLWDRIRGRTRYVRIDVEFNKGGVKVGITPVTIYRSR